MKILLVEDDVALGGEIKSALDKAGHSVDWVKVGRGLPGFVSSSAPDVVILDLGLPGLDGQDALRELRGSSRVPVIICTARDDDASLDESFQIGADDYIHKPFRMAELLARISAVSRRSKGHALPSIEHGPFRILTTSGEVFYNGSLISMTASERLILEALVSSPSRVFTRDSLEKRLGSLGVQVESNSIEVHIHNIRKKTSTTSIKTVRGLGYKLGSED